jgi:N-acetyl-anhydromuramyl-L-alanine amidase AmpD
MLKTKPLFAAAAALLLLAACGRDLVPAARSGMPSGLAAQAAKGRAVPAPELQTMLSPNADDRHGAKISAIVLHHTAVAADAWSTARFFQDPKSKVSAHYIVDRSGAIIRSVPDDRRSWHAGKSEFHGQGDVNTFSIGIEIANVGDGVEPYPAAQVQAVVKLVAWLAQTHQIPMANLTRHRDIAIPAGRKTDTSDNFDQAYVAKAAQALLDGRSMPRYRETSAPAGYDPTRQSRVIQAGDTWDSLADDVYDAPVLGAAIRALNPGVSLTPGAVIKLPSDYGSGR